MVDANPLALTTTPSMRPSRSEVIVPVSAASAACGIAGRIATSTSARQPTENAVNAYFQPRIRSSRTDEMMSSRLRALLDVGDPARHAELAAADVGEHGDPLADLVVGGAGEADAQPAPGV